MFFCSYVKYYCTQNARNDTEFCFRQKNIRTYFFSRRRAQKLCETLRLCVRINNIVCESLWRLREIYLRRDSVYSVDCFPLTSSDSDFQFCVKNSLTQRRKGRGADSELFTAGHCSLLTPCTSYLRLLKFVNWYFANLCCECQ